MRSTLICTSMSSAGLDTEFLRDPAAGEGGGVQGYSGQALKPQWV